MSKNFIFLIKVVTGLTVGCGIGAFAIAVLAAYVSSPYLEPLFNAAVSLFTFGAGALFGLVGSAVAMISTKDEKDSRSV